ncbi:AsmA family protein [Alistipes sp. An116]|uniref:AsmA-like C-terminal region-containing protein n=1 Tax=Alistipes sp. An116 TaxID=1965546 RepID=UPI000B3A23F3|nr:AsmA-like C-terminal region-containing protein [Alistipes sp. An116]OUQ54318.1 AsmA family protein [Alistipes sp. An116]
MKKFAKILTTIVVVILAIALIVPFALRGKIADIVKKEANGMLTATLDFEKLDISLLRHFPNASVELKGLTLVGAEEPFVGDTIVAARRISVVVNLLSLFGDGGYEVTKVILADPALHAHKMADGAVNWDVMKPSEEEPAAEEKPSEEGGSSFRLSVRDFRISGAVIRYEDDSTRMSFSTDPLSLRLRGDMSAERTQLDLRLKTERTNFVSGGIPLLSNAEAELVADIDADLKNMHFTFSKNTFRLNAIQVGLDGWVEMKDNAVAMDLKAGCDGVQFKDVLSLIPAFYTREFKNLTAGGELDLSLWARGQMRDSQLPAFELKTSVRNGSFQYASLPKAVTDINLEARIANPGGVMDRTEIDLSKFGLQMAGNSLAATFYATNLASDPTFRATADGKIDLGAVKEVYPLEKGIELEGVITADVQLSGRMSDIERNRYESLGAKGTFVLEQLGLTLENLPPVQIRRAAATITPAAMTLGEFGLTVGRSDLSANGQLSGYLGYLLRSEELSGRLYVKSELLDLNEIMAALPGSESDDAAAEEELAEEAAEAADTTASALEIPRNLRLSLNTDLKKVLFEKMTIENITGEMGMADGTLSLDGLRLGIFGGKASASGSYSTASDPKRPALKLKADFANASFQRTFEELEMVKQLVPIFEKTGGNYSLSLDLATALDAAMSPDLATLNASGEIRSENINIQNIKAFEAMADALGNDKLRKIEAKDVKIRFEIRDGRVNTSPFDLKIGDVNVNLSGSTGLDQTIDYQAKVAIPGGGVLQNVAVNIGGTFTSPKITLGVKEAVQEAVTNVVNEQIQKLTGSESLSEEIAKQAENLRQEARNAGQKLIEVAQQQSDKLVEEASKKGALAKLAAKKAGDKLVEEAEKQAEKLTAEAEKQIEKLTAGKQ